jgi:phosphoadenosine phosphosulfate reductase
MIATIENKKIDNPTDAAVKKPDLAFLNEKYKKLTSEERIVEIYKDFEKILLTSSFGTTAVYQLYLFHKTGIQQPVHFIDTTYHFKETLEYKEKLTKLFGLKS